ncbi:energy transducer TonB [Sphingomonas azotifigens]|uniref:energy transducer TonB n=1 Tax=Sphingomonas azotifigens TaxID=330920 RepID=UPI001FE4B36C|nr:energy transducer TonB [Sphingomonas azotifigens]
MTDDDFPAESARAGEQGTVAFTLLIDVRGLPERCEVTASSGFERLDRTACNLLVQRARFVPALDANGQPIRAPYKGRFTWVLAR